MMNTTKKIIHQPDKRAIIWSNEVEVIDQIAEELQAENSEDEKDFEEAYWVNNEYLEDEERILDKELGQPIIAAITANLWDGVHVGISDSLGTNLHDVFKVMDDPDYDYSAFYVQDGDIYSNEVHHDGRDQYLFRKLKKGIDDPDDIFDRTLNPGESLYDLFLQNTESLVPDLDW